MGLLEEEDEGFGLIIQELDHADLAGNGPFNVQLDTTGCRECANYPEKGVSLHSSKLSNFGESSLSKEKTCTHQRHLSYIRK